jgi:hypothetical protein
MSKIISFIFVFIFIAVMSTSYVLSANPFLDEQTVRQGDLPRPGGNVATGIDSIARELTALPPAHSPVSPVSPALGVSQEQLQITEWSIVGKINDKVVITNGKRERLIDNGGSIDNCVVQYPEILCEVEKKNASQ